MKKAFTIIEITLVILIVGILSSIAFLSINKPNVHQAANQFISHIRYAQHLALLFNPYDPQDKEWFKKRFGIIINSDKFTKDNISYTIFRDIDLDGNPDKKEIARDPNNPQKLLSGGFSGIIRYDDKEASKALNLSQYYGIEDAIFSPSCQFANSTRFTFDSFGRVLIGNTKTYKTPYEKNRILKETCEISLCAKNPCPSEDGENRATIVIEPESGYVWKK